MPPRPLEPLQLAGRLARSERERLGLAREFRSLACEHTPAPACWRRLDGGGMGFELPPGRGSACVRCRRRAEIRDRTRELRTRRRFDLLRLSRFAAPDAPLFAEPRA